MNYNCSSGDDTLDKQASEELNSVLKYIQNQGTSQLQHR